MIQHITKDKVYWKYHEKIYKLWLDLVIEVSKGKLTKGDVQSLEKLFRAYVEDFIKVSE